MKIAPCSLDSRATVNPMAGYGLASGIYDRWHWQEFWRRNEIPIVRAWLASVEVGSVLDAGAGTGLYRDLITACGHSVVGVDISRQMLQIQRHSNANSVLVQGSVDALPFMDSSFDNLLSTRVLTHTSILLPVFREFARVVKPGGQLFLADLHPEHPYSKMSIKANGQVIVIHIRKYSIDELSGGIASAGLELLDLHNYTLADITWRPPHDGFKNIYRDTARPIFYTARIRRP